MAKIRSGLCVLGPWDRRMVETDIDRFRVAVAEEMPSVIAPEEITEPLPFNEVWYFERVFRFLEGDVVFYTPEDVSAREALLILMSEYKRDDGER